MVHGSIAPVEPVHGLQQSSCSIVSSLARWPWMGMAGKHGSCSPLAAMDADGLKSLPDAFNPHHLLLSSPTSSYCLAPTSPPPCSASLHAVPIPFSPQSSGGLPSPSLQSSSTTAPSPFFPPSAPLSSRGGHAGLWMNRGGKTPPIPHLPGGSGGCISRTEIGDRRVPRGGGEDWERRRREAVV